MYRHLFRNRWIALAFVLMMTASAISLVGTEEGGGVIGEATAELHGQKQAFEDQAAELSRPTRSHTVIDMEEADAGEGDEALVDPGTGIDPTPETEGGFEPVPDLDPTPAE